MATGEIFDVVIAFIIDHGFTLIVLAVGLYIVHRLAHLVIEKAIRQAISENPLLQRTAEQRKREGTLIHVFEATIDVALVAIGLVTGLAELGVNTGALLAGFGVAGIAVGFGAQYLIKDLIAGFFVLLENQYRVGDVVCFDDTCGLVEDISLRMTVLRDLDGAVHHVPNGEVRISSNLSKLHANVNLNVGVAYSSDLERVIAVVNQIGNELAADEEWRDRIRTPPQFLRVEDFEPSAIVLKIVGETAPLEQWAVAGELRKRLKLTFDREGIEIPLPQMVLHQASAPARSDDLRKLVAE